MQNLCNYLYNWSGKCSFTRRVGKIVAGLVKSSFCIVAYPIKNQLKCIKKTLGYNFNFK